MTQIRLSLHCLQTNISKMFKQKTLKTRLIVISVFPALDFFFQNVMLFYEKCADPDEKSYYACGNSSLPSLFAKVPLLRESTKGKNRIT